MSHLIINLANLQQSYLYPNEIQSITMDGLKQFINDRQPQNKVSSIVYKDKDEDLVNIETEGDLNTMKDFAYERGDQTFSIDVTHQDLEIIVITQRSIHLDIVCNNCNLYPIVGPRYKSLIQNDFDLCERCEKIVDHHYPLIKIKDPSQNSYLTRKYYYDWLCSKISLFKNSGIMKVDQWKQSLIERLEQFRQSKKQNAKNS